MEQATGIEPALSAWEAEVLPLNYACVYLLIISQQVSFVNRILSNSRFFHTSQSVTVSSSRYDDMVSAT